MKKIILKGRDLCRIPLWKELGRPDEDEEIELYRLEDGESIPMDAVVSGQQLAEQFHKLYEELAPYYNYETRIDTRGFNPESNNGKLMIDVSEKILKWLSR